MNSSDLSLDTHFVEAQNKSLFEVVITTKIYSLFLILIPLLTVFGNGLVILSVFRERSLQTVTNMLIVSLATSDMLIGIFVMSFAVYFEWTDFRWNLGEKLCNFYLAIDVTCSTASILNLFIISLDRYIAISHPILYAQFGTRNHRALISIFLVWFISISVGLPILFGANPLENQQCEFTSAYFIIGSSLLSFFLPCAAMIILYTIIFYRLRQRERARILRHPTPMKSQVENENISVALFSGAQIAQHVGKYLKRQADQLFEYSYPTSTYPTMSVSSSSSLETLPIFGRSKQLDSSTQLQSTEMDLILNATIPNSTSLEPVNPNLDFKTLTRSSSTPIIQPLKKQLSSPPRSFGDQFLDSFPYIDSLSQDTLNFTTKLTNEKETTTNCLDNNIQSINKVNNHEPVDDEKIFRDLIRNYNPPFSIKKKATTFHNGLSSRSNDRLRAFDTFSLPITSLDAPTLPKRSKTTMQIAETPNTPNTDHSSIMSTSLLFAVFNSFWRSHAIESQTESKISKPNCFDRLLHSRLLQNLLGGIHLNAKPSKQIIKKASKQLRREQRVTMTLVIVLAVFLGCWVPFFSFHLSNALCIIIYDSNCVNFLATFLTTWLGYLNSALNPVIYTVFDHRFRRAFKNILHLNRCCQ